MSAPRNWRSARSSWRAPWAATADDSATAAATRWSRSDGIQRKKLTRASSPMWLPSVSASAFATPRARVSRWADCSVTSAFFEPETERSSATSSAFQIAS